MLFSYDANGNLVSDDQHTYSWDAENRLIGIGYKAQPSKKTALTYDGLGRRTAITTTNGSTASQTRYLWCGEALCQARNANDAVTRRYFSEGEEIPAAGTQLITPRTISARCAICLSRKTAATSPRSITNPTAAPPKSPAVFRPTSGMPGCFTNRTAASI